MTTMCALMATLPIALASERVVNPGAADVSGPRLLVSQMAAYGFNQDARHGWFRCGA